MEFIINTINKMEFIDITEKVQDKIKDFIKDEGKSHHLCIVYIPHATAAIMVDEFEPNIVKDYETFYSNLVKNREKDMRYMSRGYMHNRIDNNAESHLLASLIGPSKSFIIKDKKLVLGTWQSIILCEFDGPRKRRIIVEVF